MLDLRCATRRQNTPATILCSAAALWSRLLEHLRRKRHVQRVRRFMTKSCPDLAGKLEKNNTAHTHTHFLFLFGRPDMHLIIKLRSTSANQTDCPHLHDTASAESRRWLMICDPARKQSALFTTDQWSEAAGPKGHRRIGLDAGIVNR